MMSRGAPDARLNVRLHALELVVAVLFAVLSAATISPVASAATQLHGTLARHGARPCSSAQLVVWLDTSGGGAAAGSTYYRIEFTNEGASSCSLFGYPGVSAINLSGREVGVSAGRNSALATKTITVVVGATATAVVQITDTSVYPSARCAAVWAAGLRIYPPAQTVAKTVPFPFHACSSSGEVDLHVEAVERGILPR